MIEIARPEGVEVLDEITERRTPTAKVYRRPEWEPGRHKVRAHIHNIQYKHPADEVLHEINFDWQDNGDGTFGLTDTPFLVKTRLVGDGIGFWFKGSRGGTRTDIHLMALNDGKGGAWTDVATLGVPTPRIHGVFLKWEDIVPGVDIWLNPHWSSVAPWRVVRGASSPDSVGFKWEVIRDAGSRERRRDTARGSENRNRTASRTGIRDQERKLELIQARTPDEVVGERIRYERTEQWTGRVAAVDPVTRVKDWTRDFAKPVHIR